jgi:sarcosine oxidase subunit alpha
LVGFELAPHADGVPPIGEANLLIHNGNIAGRVTSIAHSPTLGRAIGLAMVLPHMCEPGANLVIRASDGREVGARVVRTPFVGAT